MYVRKIKLGDDVLLIPESADYEEGEWLPRISLAPIGSQLIPSNFYGRYKRIGNEVHIKAYLRYSGLEAANTLYLHGLPFDPYNYAGSPIQDILIGKAIINDVTAESILPGTGYLIINLPSSQSSPTIKIDIIYWI